MIIFDASWIWNQGRKSHIRLLVDYWYAYGSLRWNVIVVYMYKWYAMNGKALCRFDAMVENSTVHKRDLLNLWQQFQNPPVFHQMWRSKGEEEIEVGEWRSKTVNTGQGRTGEQEWNAVRSGRKIRRPIRVAGMRE